MTVAEIIKGSQFSNFEYYRDGNLWYRTDNDFLFPVPLEDTGTATFKAKDKTIFFMRWIRKWCESLLKEKMGN